jgi:hypothetical protein
MWKSAVFNKGSKNQQPLETGFTLQSIPWGAPGSVSVAAPSAATMPAPSRAALAARIAALRGAATRRESGEEFFKFFPSAMRTGWFARAARKDF